jgi:hypothetical protein
MIGSHFFVFGQPIALATSCHRPAPHGTWSRRYHCSPYLLRRRACVSPTSLIINHQSSFSCLQASRELSLSFLAHVNYTQYTAHWHTVCLDGCVGQIHTRMVSV